MFIIVSLAVCFLTAIHHFNFFPVASHTPIPTPTPTFDRTEYPQYDGSHLTELCILCLFSIYNLFHWWLISCTVATFSSFDGERTKIQTKSNNHSFANFLFCTLLLTLELENYQRIFLTITTYDLTSMIASSALYTVSFFNFQDPWYQKIGSTLLFIVIVTCSTSQNTHVLCVILMMSSCLSRLSKIPVWVPSLLILLSEDVHKNPGPIGYHDSFFKFCNWNLNSLAKDNFSRVKLLEAHNSLFNYDIISLCETSLKNENCPNVPELDDYTFIPANNPNNVPHGGVGLYYRNSLPAKVREDLSFDESIVLELKFRRKKIFFTVLYRSPAFKHNSPQFKDFITNFKNLHSAIANENPYMMLFTGDFNAHSQTWWPQGDTNTEGREIEEVFDELKLSQIISEATNFTPNKNPSCIDLIATDQPNLILNCGTRPSLDPFCHHQIVHCKINFRIPPQPPCERRTWYYQRANLDAIRRGMNSFPWEQHLRLNNDVNWQVKSFTEIVLNIMSNFIPNEVKRIVSRDLSWIDKELKAK